MKRFILASLGLIPILPITTSCSSNGVQTALKDDENYSVGNLVEDKYFNNEMRYAMRLINNYHGDVLDSTHSVEIFNWDDMFTANVDHDNESWTVLYTPIDGARWCTKIQTRNGWMQLSPDDIYKYCVKNNSNLIEHFFGPNEFYQYKTFINNNDATKHDFWSATILEKQVNEDASDN